MLLHLHSEAVNFLSVPKRSPTVDSALDCSLSEWRHETLTEKHIRRRIQGSISGHLSNNCGYASNENNKYITKSIPGTQAANLVYDQEHLAHQYESAKMETDILMTIIQAILAVAFANKTRCNHTRPIRNMRVILVTLPSKRFTLLHIDFTRLISCPISS